MYILFSGEKSKETDEISKMQAYFADNDKLKTNFQLID